MRVELHCHSTHSDGSFPADEVARRAAKTGVRLFCLTDHDTCAGYDETTAALHDVDCTVLRGLELSCREGNRNVHMLLYGLRDGEGLDALRARLDLVHIERRDRLVKICERLRRLGIHLDADQLLVSTHGRTAGRPDVAHALVAGGHCATPQDAFTRYLRDGGPADVPLQRLSVAEGLALGAAAGARASLAHPHTFGDLTAVRALFRKHRDAGLEGLEAFYGSYAKAQSEQWLTLVRELDLVATGGSDFHGVMNPAVTQPGIELVADRATRLCAWLGIAA